MQPSPSHLLRCLLRARLELDRTLRRRELIARALLGELRPQEYAELLLWLTGLLRLSAAPRELVASARADVRELEAQREPGSEPRALELYARLVDPDNSALAGLVMTALLGTSWTDDAAEALALRYQRDQRFLSSLSTHGYAALRRLASEPFCSAELNAFTELSRGAILGLVTQLEASWPAPIYQGVHA